MAFTTSNDVNILQSADLTAVGAGAGNDRYILDASLLTANQQITISDTEGINTLQLTGGLVITSSSVSNDAVRLTLNNGAVITVLGASSFSFQTGGALNGTGGTTQNFSTFTTSSLGIAGGVPAAGAAPATGGTVTVNANGGTGAGTVVPPVVGTTFTLTNSTDVITGTAGNDTIIAGTQAGLAGLNSGDQIDAAAGIDTLLIFGNTNATNFTSATVSNVEIVTAAFDANGGSLNTSQNAGVTNTNIGASIVTNAGGSGTASITLTKAQQAGITGTILNDTTTAAATNNVAVTVAFSDVTGGADTATLNVTNARLALNSANTTGTGNGVTLAGVETLNIVATGANALGNFAIAQTTKLNITGAGSLNATLSTAAGLTKTIDGSAATGNLVIVNAAAAAATQDIKTGSGNDVYVTVYADLASDDAISMGAGIDSLRFTDAATFNSTVTAARLTKVTGVEGLGTVGAALTVDNDFVTQNIFSTSGNAGQLVLANVVNAAQLQFGTGVFATASTTAMKLGATTLNVSLAGSATAASNLTAGLTVTGSSTVNVTSAGVDGTANNVLALTTADNQTIVVTGSQNLTLTATNAGTVTGDTINGSAFTGKLTVTGTGSSDVVIGGSGADIISGGAGAISDTLTGGAGADKFIIISGATSTTFDTITDFVTASDTILFTQALAGATGNFLKGATAVADFTAALAAANAVFNADITTAYSVQQVGADSYVFSAAPAATTTAEIVRLTGIALAGVAATDIVAV